MGFAKVELRKSKYKESEMGKYAPTNFREPKLCHEGLGLVDKLP